MNDISDKDQSKGMRTSASVTGVSPEVARSFNQANAAFRKGDWDEALSWSEKALEADSSLTVATMLRARCLTNLGRLEEACETYRDALKSDVANFTAWLELGNVCRRMGDSKRAVECYEKAVACNAKDERGHLACARILEEEKSPKDRDRAAYHYHRAIVLAGARDELPARAMADVHHKIGRFRLDRGDAPRALEALRQAIMTSRLAPTEVTVDALAEIRIDLADALLRLGLAQDAHRVLEQASQAEGEATLTRLAELSYRFNLWKEAVAVLRRNTELRPESGTTHLNLADMLIKSWQIDEALTALEKAEKLGNMPDELTTTVRATIANRLGDADTALSLYQQLVDAGSDTFSSSVAMSALYSDSLTPEQVTELHLELFAPLGDGARSRDSFGNDPRVDRPLRIGMVTADLHHQHPVNLFLQPMLIHWDYKHFPLTVYFTGRTYDEQTHLAKSRVTDWREAAPDQLARQVDHDEIDILIDLAGHTNRKNMSLFGQRLAPVQATFLGYPGTTGVPNIDWIFGDSVLTPMEHNHLYSEQIARLPDTVFCYSPEHDYPYPNFDDSDADRPLIFGSFNNIPKLTPHTIRLWSEVLKAVPGAHLLLKAPSFREAGATFRYTKLFEDQGISANRLEFRGPVGLVEMMAEYADIDIGLDPVPYNGGTTTLQAMWMGVPVVVKEGGNFASRMGASFMRAAGLPEWVADDDSDYVEIAKRMAADRGALLKLKRGLRQRLIARPGWNIRTYTSAFERLLNEMWHSHGIS